MPHRSLPFLRQPDVRHRAGKRDDRDDSSENTGSSVIVNP